MKQKEIDKRELLNLSNGKYYVIPESDYGKAEIWNINGVFFVFEIPLYGGKPQFVSEISYGESKEWKLGAIGKVLELVNSWT